VLSPALSYQEPGELLETLESLTYHNVVGNDMRDGFKKGEGLGNQQLSNLETS